MHLRCNKIGFKYPNSELHVLKDLSLSLESPGFHALFGPSGVGKTSLARIITGDIQTHTGAVEVEDLDVLLYTYNLERLPGWSSVGSHLEKVTPPGAAHLRAELVNYFGVEGCISSRFSQLSLGQKNRVNLIRYLLQEFQLLIMDESLANVDERMREKILLKIKSVFPERFFLYISHNVVEVSKFCDRIVVLRGGHKSPQTVVVSGQDYRLEGAVEKTDLEKTMLEVMNVA